MKMTSKSRVVFTLAREPSARASFNLRELAEGSFRGISTCTKGSYSKSLDLWPGMKYQTPPAIGLLHPCGSLLFVHTVVFGVVEPKIH
ncbi:MAG: hypothetical protein QOJ99_1860 [Bryobacterales bacterium]|jgi:hypothetical protein|nr:hypothetical protein [Bryobacterales bacterium]